MHLSVKILISMLIAAVVGILINYFAEDNLFINEYIVEGVFYIFGAIFIKMLKMLVVPLVFCSLIGGIVGMDDMGALGRTGLKSVALFLATTGIAISFGLFAAVTLGIGTGYELGEEQDIAFAAAEAPSFTEVIIDFAPDNIIGSMAEGNMLQIIFAAIFIGIAISHSGKFGKRTGDLLNDINEVMMSLVNIVMALAPYGVFCLMARTFAVEGFELFGPIIGYFLTVVAVLILHYAGTFSGLFFLAGLNPVIFMKKMKNTILFAFSTASSNATIPVTLSTCEERLGVDNTVAAFVVPLGATVNMNGTAIMQGIATVFVANVYQIDLGMMEYLTVIGMAVLASIGTAGVPGVGLVMLTMVFTQVGLPVEGIALIMGVDRLLDMMRTAVNVTGDAAVTCVVAKSEGKLNLEEYNDPNAGEYHPIDLNSHATDRGK